MLDDSEVVDKQTGDQQTNKLSASRPVEWIAKGLMCKNGAPAGGSRGVTVVNRKLEFSKLESTKIKLNLTGVN